MRNLVLAAIMIPVATPVFAGEALTRDLSALIESYQLPWMPEGKPLNGVRIALDASGGGQAAGDQRAADDLSLLVMHHLYHLISDAGAKVTLTRKGDHPFSVAGDADLRARVNHVLARKPQIVLDIHGQCGTAALELAGSPDPIGQDLSNTLIKTTEAQLMSKLPSGMATEMQAAKVPVVTVLLTQPCNNAAWTSKPEIFRDPAKQIYDALLRISEEHKLVAAALELTRDQREAISRRSSVWPMDDPLPLERADWFCREFARRSVSTRSLTLFEPRAEIDERTVRLSGVTNVPRLVKAMERALGAVGIESIENNMRVLPDQEALGSKLYGVCVVPQVLTYANQGTRTSLQSQLLYGETVMLMDKQGDEFLIHGGDGYWGWVIASAIRPLDDAEFSRYLNLPQIAVSKEIEVDGQRIPAGARLPSMTAALGGQSHSEFKVVLANGAEALIPADSIEILHEDQPAEQRVRRALKMLHTPYVFGGRSPLGMDCSGLVTNVCSQLGEVPARDAWQQAMAGRLVGTPWNRENIRAGDLLFYINSNGRIYHVGVALDQTHVIHASDPCVRINSASPGNRLFEARLERDFFMAKRP